MRVNAQRFPLASLPREIRKQVDAVMSRWRSYPNFAALLSALMEANGMSAAELSRQLRHDSGLAVSAVTVWQYRHGEIEPSYAFIQRLLACNPLHLDSDRIRLPEGEQPTGDLRFPFFAAAGLIEVTPDSISEWNREVMACHRRLVETNATPALPHWGT